VQAFASRTGHQTNAGHAPGKQAQVDQTSTGTGTKQAGVRGKTRNNLPGEGGFWEEMVIFVLIIENG